MTETLFDLTYWVARELGILLEGTATGGGTTSIADTVERTEANDYWNGGTAWVIYDAGGAGAAPEKEYSVITDFANSGGALTLRTTLTAAVAANDRYAIADKRIPLNVIVQFVNQAILDLGRIPVVNKTSLTIAADQTEYTLPAAVYPDNLRRVWIQSITTDADDNQWVEVFNWRVEVTATGTADILHLPAQYPSGYDLMLEYVALHPQLFTVSAKLSETIPAERVVYQAAYLCLKYMQDKYKVDTWKDAIGAMYQKAQTAKGEYPIKLPRKPSRIVNFADMVPTQPDTEPNQVFL